MNAPNTMTQEKALGLALLALDEVAKRHGHDGIINEWYVARRTIKAMLEKCERPAAPPKPER